MTQETFRAVSAASHFVPAVLWGTISYAFARFIHRRRPRGAFPRIVLALACLTTLHYATWTCAALLRGHLQDRSLLRGVLMAVTDASVIAIIALARHVGVLWSLRITRPSATWLAVNYGVCGVVLVGAVLSELFILEMPGWQAYTLYSAYLLVLGVAVVFDFRRGAERGAWRPGVLWQARTADVTAIGIALVLIAVQQSIPAVLGTTPLALLLCREPSAPALAMYLLNGASALIFATPIVVRNLGDLFPGFLTGLAMTGAVLTVHVVAGTLTARAGDVEVVAAIDAAAIVLVVFVVMPVRTWLHAGIGRLLFRRGRLRWAELHEVIHALPPEAGVVECCRRSLADLVRIMQFRGAAVLLHDGEVVTHGAIDLDGVRAVWPRDGAGLPSYTLAPIHFRDLPPPLSAALTAADILVVIPIVSPRRRWGWVFVTTDLRGASFGDEDDAAVGAVVDQVALTLDAAHLLERAVSVERSLAHAEKLAAIGELAARFAHDIRNPVTAARSLAQQLARDPLAPENAEHVGIILEELERVERQVRDLLRFARREELRLEPVDLVALVRATVAELRSLCDAVGVAIAIEAGGSTMVRGDREKLRQVVVNLVENACDALGEAATRRVVLGLSTRNGTVTLSVADTGPGVPPDALPRLFEPFYTRKANGTGLGLAIVKRTIDAHGGRIEASSAAGAGMTFRIELPGAPEALAP